MNGNADQRWSRHPDLPLPGHDGTVVVLMVPTPHTSLRGQARELVRNALREFLAPLLGCPPAAVPLQITPGHAPTLNDGSATVHLSISHEAGLSLAAVRIGGGSIGVDLMRADDATLPEWETLVRDYLGQKAVQDLEDIDALLRALAFAEKWTRHEACLKCLGLPLQEWSQALAVQLSGCHVWPLALPDGYTGALAMSDQPPRAGVGANGGAGSGLFEAQE